MSPRDDVFWRQLVADARVRPHEVRRCEGDEPVELPPADVAELAERALHRARAGRRPRHAWRRRLAAALMLVAASGSMAWVSVRVFHATASSIGEGTYGPALVAELGELSDAERRTVFRTLTTHGLAATRDVMRLTPGPGPLHQALDAARDAIRDALTRPLHEIQADLDPKVMGLRISELLATVSGEDIAQDAKAAAAHRLGQLVAAGIRTLRELQASARTADEAARLARQLDRFRDVVQRR